MGASFAREVRQAVRSLLARPSFAIVSVLTVALVVAAASAVLAVVDAAFVRPLPFPASDRLVQVYTLPPNVRGVSSRNPLASIDFVRFRQRIRLADGLAGQWARDRAIGGVTEPESVPTTAVSSNFFQVLGVSPALGRTFTDAEDRAGAKLVVLSDALWQRRFGGRTDVLGQRLSIDREDHEIVGVMPRGFNPAYVASQLWTPLGVYEGSLVFPNATFIQSVARLKPGATVAQLAAELSSVMADVAREQAVTRGGWTTDVATLRDAQFGQTHSVLVMLLAAIVALGLIAGANLMNLTVAEVAGRRGELVLRAALGAARGRLLRLQATEALIVALAGAALGLAAGAVLLPAILALDSTRAIALQNIAMDWRSALAAAGLALAIGLVAGGLPVLAATRGDIATGLGGAGRRLAGSRAQRRVRFVLVAAETLLAVVLLAAGALLLDAFNRNARTQPGFDARQVLAAQVRLPASVYATVQARATVVQAMLERIRATPGIVDAGAVNNPFIPGFTFITLVRLEGKPAPDGQPYTVQFRRVTPGYFRTLKIPELRGRTFDDHDVETSMPVAVVSRLFAERYYPGEDVLGRRIQRTADVTRWLTVVGVVGDVSDVGFSQAAAPALYVTHTQNNAATAPIGLVVRTAGEPAASAHAIARAIQEIDPAQPLANVTTLDRFLGDSLGPDRFRSVLLLVFAGMGLAMAAVGIYGVTARGVAERRREMSVRLALGCQPSALWRLALWQALSAVGAGFLLGLPAAAAARFALRHWLSGLESISLAATLPAFVALALVGVLAAAIPALRAMRADPLAAMRAE